MTANMSVICLAVLVFGSVCLEVTGRAVNISGAWFLPEEGFPVFYRYFSDKVTWNEAEAVCGFHHGDLLSVQTNTQMDAARAYLKEIDVTDNIWIGLRKDSPEKPFSWTNGEKLLGDGYWLEPIPKTNEKLCAAIDPASDFRWNSFYCRGPQVSSFVCELPVPEWAKKEDGCLITSLPSVVITFIPEMGVIQLFSDCGLEGTRRIACKGGMNREDLIRRLSCDEDAFATTVFSKSTTDTSKDQNTIASTWEDTTKKYKIAYLLEETRHRREVPVDKTKIVTLIKSPNTETNSLLVIVETDLEAPTQTVSTQGTKETSNAFTQNVFQNPPVNNYPTTKNPEQKVQTTKKPENEEKLEPKVTADSNQNQKQKDTEQVVMAVMPTDVKSLPASPDLEHDSTTEPLNIPAYYQEVTFTDQKNDPDQNRGVPVLIITGESFNASGNSATPTPDNPPIVLMIDDKEDFSEPYVVPLVNDVVLNNPSLSPVEVIDVDLIEIDNSTMKTTVTVQTNPKHETSDVSPATSSPSQPTPTEIPETSKPTDEVFQNESSTVLDLTTIPNTPKPSPTPTTTKTTETPKSVTQQPQTFLESDDREDQEIPQRPNRGRIFSQHPNHSSFYPYFLNRVWG